MPSTRISWRSRAAAAAVIVVVAACSAPASKTQPKATAALSAWGECSITESSPGLECGTLTVPFDYAKPDGPTFTIPMVRIPSKSNKPRLLLTNPGGPGIGGVKDLISTKDYFDDFADTHTVVSFDPRGVAGSQPAIGCIDDRQKQDIFNQPSVPTSAADQAHARELAAGIGESCRRQFGEALGHVGTANVARDMDEIRKAMGFDQIDYLGYSYGTFLGALYADMFPGKTDRVALDSVLDPTLSYQEIRHGQANGMQQSVTAFVDDCLARPDCALTGPTDHAVQQISGIIGELDRHPFTGDDGRALSGARMLALVESAQYFPKSGWPTLRETLTHALAGRWAPVLEAAYSPDLMVNPADSQYLSVVNIDFQTERDPELPGRLAPLWAATSPISGANRAWSLQPGEMWPSPPVRTPGPLHAQGAGQVLILNTTGDPATPLAWAQSLHDQIDGSTLVIAPSPGHIASAQNTCAGDALTAFLKQGALPAGPTLTCPADR